MCSVLMQKLLQRCVLVVHSCERTHEEQIANASAQHSAPWDVQSHPAASAAGGQTKCIPCQYKAPIGTERPQTV